MTLADQIEKMLAFDRKRFIEQAKADDVDFTLFDVADYSCGAEAQLEYLQPLHIELIRAVRALEYTKWNIENDFGRCGTTFIDEALDSLSKLVKENGDG
jgi:hypothetical protein